MPAYSQCGELLRATYAYMSEFRRIVFKIRLIRALGIHCDNTLSRLFAVVEWDLGLVVNVDVYHD